MKDFIETRIIDAIRGLLTGKVNERIRQSQFSIPIIEFGDYGCGYAVTPVITLNACECTEKERIIRLDAYSLIITFTLPESPESELYCYAYSGAVSRAVYDDPTLGGIAERVVISGRKYLPPKKPYCGEEWQLIISLRITVSNEQ